MFEFAFASILEARRVVEVASSDALPDEVNVRVALAHQLDALAHLEDLLADVARHLQRAVLDVVLEAPGYREVRFLPLLVHLRWQVRQRL